MFSRLFIPVLVLLLLPLYLFLCEGGWEQRVEIRRSAEAGYVIPSRFTQILALEHDGLLADFLLLKVITFFGERIVNELPLNNDDWQFIIGSLDAITDLDPFFLDPYLLGEGLLTWEAGRYDEANRLLEKGRKFRTDDWQIPFFIGFNYFFFLQDRERGAEYLMEASRLPKSPTFLPTLAARLGYYEGKSKTAILFLKGLLAQTGDERIRASLEKRLTALERASSLEDLVEKFYRQFQRPPDDLEELVTKGFIDKLPSEPYGGKWIIIKKNGRVFSTSRFVMPRSQADTSQNN
jgi:tetratricopeptide (TPR) repeat protein